MACRLKLYERQDDVEINSLEDLRAKEDQIRRMLQRCKLDRILLGLRRVGELDSIGRYPPIRPYPFIIAGTAMFALRYCPPRPFENYYRPLPESALVPLIRNVSEYLLADPVSFDSTIQQEYYHANPVFTFLRLVASQFPFQVSPYGQYARSLVLYEDLPSALAARSDIPPFDFAAAFQVLNGVALTDFIKVGWIAWVAARSHPGFARDYFTKAREQGIDLPQDRELIPLLDQLTTTADKFVAEYNERSGTDPRFAMYNFNPLFLYPIVRPYQFEHTPPPEEDAMVAPLPDLILSRLSVGIFYQVFNEHRTEFSQYFGHLFSEYVGTVLRHSVPSGALLSEEDIRNTYPEERGKVPDWAVIDGSTAVLVECKATRFTRAALTTGDENAVNDSLKQVITGLKQLDEFTKACEAKKPGLEQFHHCNKFEPVLATLEPLHLINSTFFREHIDQLLAEKDVNNLPWLVLPLDELEVLQPHLAAGIGLSETIDKLRDATFNEVLEGLIEQTGRTYKDSFLYPKEEQLFRLLGL